MTLLLTAVKCGNLKVMRNCVSNGANVNVKDDDGWTPLHHMARGGCLDIVKYLISAGADVNAKDKDDRTILHCSDYKNVNTVKTLISAGAEVNLKDSRGQTPLHYVAREGGVHLLKILIAAGADINGKELHGRTPLHFSAGLEDRPYFHSIDNDDVGEIKTLISAGAEVNVKDNQGQTPLHYVAKEGRIHLLKVLIAAGTDINVKEKRGWTPLHFSAGRGFLNIVKTLIVSGANVNAKNLLQQTPLHFAAIGGHVEILKVLVAAGAIIDSKDTDGVTPLEYAGIEYSEEACKFLIKFTMLHIYRPMNPSFALGKITMRDVEKLIVFWNKCKKQVKNLKETFLGNTCVSFYKFLRETDENKIAFYTTEKNFGINNSLRRALCNIKKFPIYAKDIEFQFNKGSRRGRLLMKVEELIKSHICKVLPAEIIRNIIEYLKNEDLKMFLSAFDYNKGA